MEFEWGGGGGAVEREMLALAIPGRHLVLMRPYKDGELGLGLCGGSIYISKQGVLRRRLKRGSWGGGFAQDRARNALALA